MSRLAWTLLLGLALAGCSQKYTLLRGTAYRNPPKQRLRVLVLDFGSVGKDAGGDEQRMAREAQGWFESQLALDFVDSSTEAMQTPDAPAPRQERTKTRNPFVLVDRAQAMREIRESGIDLAKPLDRNGLLAIGKLDVTDLVLVGSVGMSELPRLDLVSGQTGNVVLGASLTVPVVRMGIVVADTESGAVLLDARKQRRYREDSDPIATMAQEAMGEILWTSFF